MDNRHARIVLTTVGSEEEAGRLARLWVGSRRATCVTRLPGAVSLYPWQGKVEEATEVLLLVKAAVEDDADLEALLASLAADHPYDEPELLVLRPEAGSAGYLDWLLAWRRGGDA
ncbi:MAG: divalent-cation tolerance protein CutA [Planctomycetota bacterium]